MQIKLGERMRELRRKRGRTQDDLAQALGVTPQAVSRWENGICYPDMELLPSMANFFGVSIDELFGYQTERSQKIDELAERIRTLNAQNNGKDVCMTECLRLARESAAEFPGNETLTFCLASVLYNAGYVRYGEYHCTDENGYDVYATEHHRTYDEWKEAIALYEKLLETLPDGSMRQQAIRELI
ncbi:MAG: helix-turn-helix domain-containing protein [Clostridia bacterium]|nr:helix-turn-helix domain-containing protein [Clostridia bacterium]